MKRFQTWFGLTLATLLPACSFHQTTVTLQPVGPAPVVSAAASHDGTLVVYSAINLYGDPRNVSHHSDYVVTSQDGKVVRRVQNHIDRFDEGPQPVSLAPGSYTVNARAARYGKVNVPVIIKDNQSTTVYLDGYPHSEAPGNKRADAVKLPDGQVVGWSANDPNNSSHVAVH